MEVTVKENSATTVYINHPTASYGIFCYNDIGDLFLNSDYGMFGYAWRSFGENFKEFLSQINTDYLMGKFEINYRNTSGKKIPKYWRDNVETLCQSFIDTLKQQITPPQSVN